MAEEANNERVNNLVALSIAVWAAFVAITAIKGSNVEQQMAHAEAERNNSWAWYQAVRVREDMATYQLANLQREARHRPDAQLQAEITEQIAEVGRVRERKDEVQARATAAEAEHARLSVFDDQYDISSALISIAMAILAVCLLVRLQWLFWFSLAPGLLGMAFGLTAMLQIPVQVGQLIGWLG
ncbi:MAG: DUF4337 domain-containing protein [Alphaproteobacteria bacterium]|nr:DUF4337 domain-containing protein [Alphaproteobacteria bacterium]